MLDDVLAVMQRAAEAAILPRFRALQEGDIEEKAPGDLVTRADREAEALISAELLRMRPDAVVIGEEATAADASLLDALLTEATVWLVDPLDGTANFVAGTDAFAVMVALVERGETTHAWIWQPLRQEAWTARLGDGTRRNGARVQRPQAARPDDRRRGAVRTAYLSPDHRAHVDDAAASLGEILPGTGCAGVDYPNVLTGALDYELFVLTMPWDHAPGTLLVREAGGVARRWDGSDYKPNDKLEGLIVASDEATWQRAIDVLVPATYRVPTYRV